MKIKRIVLVLCAFLLSSCGNPGGGGGGDDKPTYTITIAQVDNFTPSHSSFTFKENDFSPIVLSYSTTQNYLVFDAKASEDAAECRTEYKDNEMEIIPCKNTDFTVTVTMIHLSEASIIRIVDDTGHFHTNRNKIVFKNNDFTPVSVRYITDNYCRLNEAKERSNKAHCEIDNKTSTLIITPNDNGELFIDVNVSEQYKIMNFNPNGGELASSAKDKILIPYDESWSHYVNLKTQYAINNHYATKGWTFAENPEIGDEVLDPSSTLNEDSLTTVYAVYQHNVNVISESLEFTKIDYSNGEDDDIRIYFNLKNSVKYVLPEAKESFTVTNSFGEAIDVSKYVSINDNEAYIDIPSDANIEDGLINVTVNDYQPTYSVDASLIDPTNKHLTYNATSAPKRGEDFVFTLEAINTLSANDAPYYYVPDQREQISISVKEGETYNRLGVNAYKIEFDPDDIYQQKGVITVFGEYVKGDLKIDAMAVVSNGYFYALIGCEVTFENQSDYLSSYFNADEPHIEPEMVYLADDEAAKRVTKNNVAIRAVTSDGTTNWYTLDEFTSKYGRESVNYDPIHRLFAFWDLAQNNIKAIYIHVYDPQYSVFEKVSWAQLDELTSIPNKYISMWFKVGETRTIQIDNLTYTLRIIGINHDNLTGGGKAGLTIEFADVISNSKRKGIKIVWTESHYDLNIDFPNSAFNNLLNDSNNPSSFINKLPADLRAVVKTVDKIVGLGEKYSIDTPYSTILFPLSVREMHAGDIGYTADEGETYEYYLNDDASRKVKRAIDGSAFPYWLRSPFTDGEVLARYVRSNGTFHHDQTYFDDNGYSPAFCV